MTIKAEQFPLTDSGYSGTESEPLSIPNTKTESVMSINVHM